LTSAARSSTIFISISGRRRASFSSPTSSISCLPAFSRCASPTGSSDTSRSVIPSLYKKVIGVALVSARSGAGVSEALRRIDIANSEKRDIFVVGCTNVGKSTFVNRVLRSDANSSRIADITVSRVHGTTLANIYAPYPRQAGVHLVDTPGLVSQKTIVANAGVEPSKRVRTVTVRLRRGKSVFFGGLTRIDYTEGDVDAVYLTLFAASECTVHVTGDRASAAEVHATSLRHAAAAAVFGAVWRRSSDQRFIFGATIGSSRARSRLDGETRGATRSADIVLPGVGWCAVNARHAVRAGGARRCRAQ
jgi:hypothetical protein